MAFDLLPVWCWEHEWNENVLPILKAESRFQSDETRGLFVDLRATENAEAAVLVASKWIKEH